MNNRYALFALIILPKIYAMFEIGQDTASSLDTRS